MQTVSSRAGGWSRQARGASLVDAVIASAIVITVTAGLAQLLVWTRRSAFEAGTNATALWLAVQKMEQLRSLSWYVDASGLAVSDQTTNLSPDPPSGGGSGLRPSPADALQSNTPGYVDYLDGQGRWCGTGRTVPGCAAFVRRWAVAPSADDPEILLLGVTVQLTADASAASPVGRGARLITRRTRVLR